MKGKKLKKLCRVTLWSNIFPSDNESIQFTTERKSRGAVVCMPSAARRAFVRRSCAFLRWQRRRRETPSSGNRKRVPRCVCVRPMCGCECVQCLNYFVRVFPFDVEPRMVTKAPARRKRQQQHQPAWVYMVLVVFCGTFHNIAAIIY